MNSIVNYFKTRMAPQKYFRILSISLGTGLILTFVQFFLPSILYRGISSWTGDMISTLHLITALLTVVLFLWTGFFYLKDMTPFEIFLSAVTFGIYSFILLFLDWFFRNVIHAYPSILAYFLVPCSWSLQPYYLLSQHFSFPYLFPLTSFSSMLTAFCYIPFGRKPKPPQE